MSYSWRMDWYESSLPGVAPMDLMEAVSKLEFYGDWQHAKPGKGYDQGAEFVLGEESIFRLSYGGQNEEHGPHITGSGRSGDTLATFLRERFPEHRVSRMDSCQDFHSPRAWRTLRRVGLATAKAHKLKAMEIRNPLSLQGSTLYLGASSSLVSARIYQKDLEQGGTDPDLVRVEMQLRPKKELKSIAAGLSAQEAWGVAKWTHALATAVGTSTLERVDYQVYKQSDDDRAYRFLLKQYGPLLARRMELHGSWETLGAQIGLDLSTPPDRT